MKTALQLLLIIFLVGIYSAFYLLSLPFGGLKTEFFGRGMRWWARIVLKACGITLVVEGAENLVPGGSYVYVANHASLFDIPAIVAGVDGGARYIYKKELEKVPVWGWALRLSPFVGIDRSNGKDSMAGIEQAIEEIRKGESFVVFAEGTRSKDGTLGDFKRGAFMLASRSGKHIIPTAIVGSNAILKPGTFKIHGGVIRIVIGKPITPIENPSKADEVKLMAQTRNIIAKHIEEGI